MKLHGRWIIVRTCSPDARVALSCFGGEFDELLRAVPRLRHGLIIDGGGYIGTAAIVFAEAFPEATIVTLEPSQGNYEVLKMNVSSYPNIRPMMKALTPRSGQRTLRNRGTGEWGFTIVDNPRDNTESQPIESVDCITIEEIMGQLSKVGVDILKLDIEGGEHSVLGENNDWIGRTGAICIELHDRIVDGCTSVYQRVTEGRENSKMAGEKFLSISGALFSDNK
ncbi:FkbM family methyltransferase [Sphingosinicella sp. CPCC 101087]|uniref:FkbM family methyltransferase n=1 Tax=Sphingosinicella sp. CPCC 101087 TaxID=2497754 RepID=UPI0013EE24AB|nr:FkbM family methyltransferase [Sphingosinicella sp. CPCC 101087]